MAGNPPSYPQSGTYADLLYWHLFIWRTRKEGSTEIRGDLSWTKQEFLTAVFGKNNAKAVSEGKGFKAWIGSPPMHPPLSVTHDLIKKAIFGDNPNFERWRHDLDEARTRSRGKGNNVRTITLEGALAGFEAGQSQAASIPHPAKHFQGRERERDMLVEVLLSSRAQSHILVQGGPGIGKTELTKAIAHHTKAVDQFGRRRWFVSLETAPTPIAMQQAIAAALGFTEHDGFSRALKTLGTGRTLLVLDNFETPWDQPSQRDGIREILNILGAMADLHILASMRGAEWVGGLDWVIHPVGELHRKASSELFASIAGDWAKDDPLLSSFLDALGGVPLSLQLVARRAFGRGSLQPIWNEWKAIGPRSLVDYSDAPAKLTSLPFSIELSLQSSRITAAARRLFSFLGMTPAGLTDVYCHSLLGDEAFRAIDCLIRTGLAHEQAGDRLTLLPPVREYAKWAHPAPEKDFHALFKFMQSEIRNILVSMKSSDDHPITWRRFHADLSNFVAAINMGLAAGMQEEAIYTLHMLGVVTNRLTVPPDAVYEILADCESRADVIGQAECWRTIAWCANGMCRWNTALDAFEKAYTLFDAVDSGKGKAGALYGLGSVHYYRISVRYATQLKWDFRNFELAWSYLTSAKAEIEKSGGAPSALQNCTFMLSRIAEKCGLDQGTSFDERP